MFDPEDTRWLAAPSSSPPSSPTAYNDSSPASSPGPEDSLSLPEDLGYSGVNPPHGSPPPHPFAASAKGSWIPPEYEKGGKKNRRMSPSSPTRSRVKKPRLIGPERSLETLVAASPRTSISLTEAQKETVVWDTAIGRMVDHGNGAINLDNSNLSTIPKEVVADMQKFCVLEDSTERLTVAPFAPPPLPSTRAFVRSSTAPAILGPGLSFARVPERTLGFTRRDIQLYLACNQISRIPVQLLHLEKLTVLSLRSNKLKILPPEVRHLSNLHTLNVSGNQLQFLPAEISEMRRLQTLHVFPNHFKEPEEHAAAKHQFRRAKSAQGRVAISPTSRIPTPVPSLVELAFRSMFSSVPGLPRDHSNRRIAQYYELPLCEDSDLGSSSSSKKEFYKVIPPHLRRVLDAVHPGSVYSDESSEPADDQPSLGLCPSPRHIHRASVFVTPAEERYTWETVVAGVDVGGNVPLKWRGCSWGCLDFLSEGMAAEQSDMAVVDMEVDVQNGAPAEVTQVTFAPSQGFGLADFEDGG
ncbi:hypothetical protein DFH09DRAFT_1137550 [Mycena vulgaris]|nr:hypothetical protein DFH09DRAFT_1137550 [Mycena vulgaris]